MEKATIHDARAASSPGAAKRIAAIGGRTLALPTVALVLALACSGGGGPSGPGGGGNPPPDGVGTIGPSGGTVALSDDASVQIPAGALANSTEIRITAVATPADLQAEGAIGQAYRFEPTTVALNAPARIFIKVPPAALGGGSLDDVVLRRSTGGAAVLVPAGVELGNIQRSPDGTVSGTSPVLGTFSAAFGNRPPTADAGDDQIVEIGQEVQLSGSGNDPDGDDLSFEWEIVEAPDGSEAELVDNGDGTASIVVDAPGIFEFRLTVEDEAGESASDTVVVEVTGIGGNRVPRADAGDDQSGIKAQNTVHLDGSGSNDPDGDELTYFWGVVSSPGAAPPIAGADEVRATFVPQAQGTYVIELTVDDGEFQDTDTVTIMILPANRAPIVTLQGPDAVFAGEAATVAATINDPDGDPLVVDFGFESPAGSAAVAEIEGNEVSFTTDLVGEYRVTVTASDGEAQTQLQRLVYANPMVAGDYEVAVVLDATQCQDGDVSEAQGVLPIRQPSAGVVIIDLPEIDEAFLDPIEGTLRGEAFLFQGTLRVRGEDGSTITLNGFMDGTIRQAGSLDLEFIFSVFTCVVSGTIDGVKI